MIQQRIFQYVLDLSARLGQAGSQLSQHLVAGDFNAHLKLRNFACTEQIKWEGVVD